MSKIIPVYVFAEIYDVEDNDCLFSYKVDDTVWTLLEGLIGPNGGNVYVYKNGKILKAKQPYIHVIETIDTLAGVEIMPNCDDDMKSRIKTFRYMCQSEGFATPREAFETCWGN